MAGKRLDRNSHIRSDRCLYCGITSKTTLEHVIPDSLGGTETIKAVCPTCNNGILSILDNELASNSPLGLLASHELPKKRLTQVWAVQDGRMLEGRFDPLRKSFSLYPQILFLPGGNEIRGAGLEILEFGPKAFVDLLVRRMREAFELYEYGEGRQSKRALIFDPIKSPFLTGANQFPPRLFAPRTIQELEGESRLILRYLNNDDRRHALNRIQNWRTQTNRRRFRISMGTPIAGFHFSFSKELCARALLKMSLNLIKFICRKTPVIYETFSTVCQYVTGVKQDESAVLRLAGLASAPSVASMLSSPSDHRIWLTYASERQSWDVQFSFFGGKAGALASVPGPCDEDHKFIDVRAPVDGSPWIVERGRIAPVLTADRTWTDLNDLIPSVQTHDLRSAHYLQKRKPQRGR